LSDNKIRDEVGGVWSTEDFKEQLTDGLCSHKYKQTQQECVREEHPKRVMLMLLGNEGYGYKEYIRQQGECDESVSDEDED
jgi:hypothetical protein